MKAKKYWVLVVALVIVAFATAHAQFAATDPVPLPTIKPPRFSRLNAHRVVRVVDGDTIVVYREGRNVTIRLVGVDTPEIVDPKKPVEYYGKEASIFVTNLLKGEKVYLRWDTQEMQKDRYGRILAYVYRVPDGLFVNAEIIRQGYGYAYTKFGFHYKNEFKQLQQFAIRAKKGLWAAATATSIGNPKSDQKQ